MERGWGATLRFAVLAVGVATALLLAAPGRTASPGNDTFASAKTLTAATGSYNGTNVEATKEPGEPVHASNAGGASVWYRWTAPVTGIATFETYGFDTLLAVYTGASVSALTLVAENDDANAWKGISRLSFAATAGQAYSIALDGYNDGSGPLTQTFAINWEIDASGTTPANDPFASAVPLNGPNGSVSGSTLGSTKETGEPAHAGNAGGRSVWFRWTAPDDGIYRFTTESSTFDTLLAVYTGIGVGALTEVGSNNDIAWNNLRSAVSVGVRKGVTYSIAVDGNRLPWSGTASGTYTLAWQAVGPLPGAPANDWLSTAQMLSAASGSTTGSNAGAGLEAGEPAHAGNPGGASVWYRWTAPASGTATFSTAGSAFDTLLAAYTGSAYASLALVASNDDAGAKGPSQISFPVLGGQSYAIAVDGYVAAGGSPATGSVVLAWSLGGVAPPANDAFAAPIEIGGTGGVLNRTTLGATEEAGEPDHAGNPGGASVWFKWHAAGDGLWRFYTTGSGFDTLLAVYTGDSLDSLTLVGSSDNVSATDLTSSVTFVARADTSYYVAVDGYRGAQGPAAAGSLRFLWELLGPAPETPPNDDFASARVIGGTDGPSIANNALATKEPGEPDHAGNPGGASLWFKWTAPMDGRMYFDTPGSSFDTLLAIYTGTSLADLQLVAASDDIAYEHWWRDASYPQGYASFPVTAGTTYFVAVDGKSWPGGHPETGSVYLDWWLSPPAADAKLLAAGNIASCAWSSDEQTAALVAAEPDATVATLGDHAYPDGAAADFACYDATWGPFKPRTAPAVGNHDLDLGPGPYYGYFASAAGAPGKGWYSYEVGNWHVVVLNSSCNGAGCAPAGEQLAWLEKDLLAHRSACTLAYWHHPLFSSTVWATPDVRPFWDVLYANGADVVVNAHAHTYERFAPQTPAGTPDAAGIREFVVGTGGAPFHALLTPRSANSVISGNTTHGVLKLLLGASAYSWQFVPVPGGTLRDSGAAYCNGTGSGTDTGTPGGPTAPGTPTPSATLTRASSLKLKWGASSDPSRLAVTYRIEQRDADDTAWSTLKEGISGTSWTVAPAEGTRLYRVRATNSIGGQSAPSAQSAAVVVDWTAPQVIFTPTRPPDYAGGGGWWRGSLTVSVSGDDPRLPDGSAGSGPDPASYPSPATKSGSTLWKITVPVKDRAGNRSPYTTAIFQLDTEAPSASISCPSGTLVRNSERYATYTAKDDRSGLAIPATGRVRLDTSSRGDKRVYFNVPDNVGNVKSVNCGYKVG